MDAALSTIDTQVAANESGFLFDQPDFKTELAKLDLGPDPADAATAARRRTLAEWADEEGLELTPPDDSIQDVQPPTRDDAMHVVAFVALMFIGAAAAAVVFHEQVSRILSTF